jgi:hypothetical protein
MRSGRDLAVYVHRYLAKRRARIVEAVRMRRVSTRSGRRYAWTYATSSVRKDATSSARANPASDAGPFSPGGGDTFVATSERSTVSAAGDASPFVRPPDRDPFRRTRGGRPPVDRSPFRGRPLDGHPLDRNPLEPGLALVVTAGDANTFDPLQQFPLHQLALDQSAFNECPFDQSAFNECPVNECPVNECAFDQSAFNAAGDAGAFTFDGFALGADAERSAEHVPEVGTPGPGELRQGARLGDPDLRCR